MDYVTSASIIGTSVAIGGSLGILWYMARRAPRGYENEAGFHYGEPPIIVLETPPAIDWSKPLELLGGTPVRLDAEGFAGGPNPDKDGDFWVVREDGGSIRATTGHFFSRMCVHPSGCEETTRTIVIRNRAARAVPVAANSNAPALTDDQRAVLLEMSDEIGWTAAVLRERTGLHHARVTEARRQLADMGLAILTSLRDCGGESNQLAGRGYILTPDGVAARDWWLDHEAAA